MSEENVEVVRRVYDAVARGDTEAVLSAYDPEVVWDFTDSPLGGLFRQRVYHGHDGLRNFIRERYEDAWQSIEDHCVELIDAGGDHVSSVVETRGRGRASGAMVEITHAGLWTLLRNDKIVRVAWLGGRAEALEAAGLAQ